jgi:hypothetical protein
MSMACGWWLVAGGWSAILTDIPVDSPDMGEPPRYSEVRLPGRTSAVVSSLTLGRGTS